MRDGSGQRQGLRRAVENSGIAGGKSSRLDCKYRLAGKVDPSHPGNLRERSSEHVQRAALIMQIERAVMVVGVRICGSCLDMRVMVSNDRRRLIHIERVIVEQRSDAGDLRNHEDCQQECANALDVAKKSHRRANRSRASL